MPDKQELRQLVRENVDDIMLRVNAALRGEELAYLEPVLNRLGRGERLPHWFNQLKSSHTLPNLDGKTIGSVLEMIFVSVLETSVFADLGLPPMRINPARGVDIPDLDLGVKSPSKNYDTSEPFFSAYERLIGSEYDAVVMLTDYQEAKRYPPLRLQITEWRYLAKTQIADEGLCRLAKKHRDWLVSQNEAWAKKVCRFLAFVNQSDWRAKELLRLVDCLNDDERILTKINAAEANFESRNIQKEKLGEPLFPESEIEAIRRIRAISPLHLGVIDAADSWVVETQKEAGRFPNENEWNRYLSSSLDGAIGMSFALQWRYNFRKLFVTNS